MSRLHKSHQPLEVFFPNLELTKYNESQFPKVISIIEDHNFLHLLMKLFFFLAFLIDLGTNVCHNSFHYSTLAFNQYIKSIAICVLFDHIFIFVKEMQFSIGSHILNHPFIMFIKLFPEEFNGSETIL